MKTCYAYRFDIDNTIAQPLFFNRDVPTCIQYYIQASIITPEETTHVQSHPHLYILPQVALTHLPLPGAVEALQHLAQEGASIQYFTVRQSVESEQCQRIRQNTHVWLERHQFPCPMQVRFCRNLAEKLVQALEASEPYILLIDDRPGQLLQAYEKVAEYGPQIAQ